MLDSQDKVKEELKASFPLVRCTEDMFKDGLEKDTFKIGKLENAYCVPEKDELYVMNTESHLAAGKQMSALKITAYPCSKDTKD